MINGRDGWRKKSSAFGERCKWDTLIGDNYTRTHTRTHTDTAAHTMLVERQNIRLLMEWSGELDMCAREIRTLVEWIGLQRELWSWAIHNQLTHTLFSIRSGSCNRHLNTRSRHALVCQWKRVKQNEITFAASSQPNMSCWKSKLKTYFLFSPLSSSSLLLLLFLSFSAVSIE